jgi:hypothetical protein
MTNKSCRYVRFLIGAVIAALGVFFRSWWGLVGIVPMIWAFSDFCPVCAIMKSRGCSHPKPDDTPPEEIPENE